jgi:hypothetical protein
LEAQLAIFDLIAEIDGFLDDFDGDDRNRIPTFLDELADICCDCDFKSAMINERVIDYLKKFGKSKREDKKGKILSINRRNV